MLEVFQDCAKAKRGGLWSCFSQQGSLIWPLEVPANEEASLSLGGEGAEAKKLRGPFHCSIAVSFPRFLFE